VTGILNQGRTATVLLRGSNKMVLEEAERSLHDALCVIRCLVQKRFLVTGGASPEVEVSYQLSQWSKTLQVRPQSDCLCVCVCGGGGVSRAACVGGNCTWAGNVKNKAKCKSRRRSVRADETSVPRNMQRLWCWKGAG